MGYSFPLTSIFQDGYYTTNQENSWCVNELLEDW